MDTEEGAAAATVTAAAGAVVTVEEVEDTVLDTQRGQDH